MGVVGDVEQYALYRAHYRNVVIIAGLPYLTNPTILTTLNTPIAP